MSAAKPRLLVLGAHPDDAEFHCGGLIAMHRRRDHEVKIVSVTDGAAGHHRLTAGELASIRQQEAAAVAELIGVQYEVWEFPDGELQPTLEVRRRIIREIRSFAPDLVLTHRTNDYHPDHRAVGQAVQDASFTVTVPLIVADTPALRRDPVVAYMVDFFTKPLPHAADVVLDITHEFATVVELLACHRSQVYEWLPYNLGRGELPQDARQQKEWLTNWYAERAGRVATHFRSRLVATYGQQKGSSIEFAEAYEISEYAGPMDAELQRRLFPGCAPESQE